MAVLARYLHFSYSDLMEMTPRELQLFYVAWLEIRDAETKSTQGR